MTVKELRRKLCEFDDNAIVLIPNSGLYRFSSPIWYVPAFTVTRGINELDGYVFIDSFDEEYRSDV